MSTMQKIEKKLAFFGGGHMAEGIIRGLLGKEIITPDKITVCEIVPARRSYLTETYGVAAFAEAKDGVAGADMVLIGVNPSQVPMAAKAIKPFITKETVVLSYAAGVKMSTVESELGSDTKVVRIMPNTLSQSGCGYTSVTDNGKLNQEDKELVEAVVKGLGKIIYLDEEKFNSFTAYSCTGPLWIYKFTEAMIEAGVYIGFSRADAREMILENMMGVTKLLQETGSSPTAKVEEMTSPGGVTIEALRAIHDNGGYVVPTTASMDMAVKKCSKVAESVNRK